MCVRSTTETIHDHLLRRLKGDLEGDLENYAENVVQLTGSGQYHGRDGVRACAAELDRLIGEAEYTYNETLVDGPYAFLQWTAGKGEKRVTDGADSFVVADGLIVMQSIHYTPRAIH